ncbi:hypothetical protein [Streptomyces albicerus]|uniref:hypothetical protein n=1 Tax=Streptomyces albicerus TaxID=2569859 RepID=UPI00124B2330|nr:hypothetical protein [Streptomyces albicerus]
MTARKHPIDDSFDAFWDEQHGGHRTTVVKGVTVVVPNDLPVGFGERYAALSDSSSDEDVAELIAMLFGEEAAEKWLAPPKIGTRQLMTVLLWGMAQASGDDITFAEALERVTKELKGKAQSPNRAARRAVSKKPSASTGGQSRPTSAASTTSARKSSRA